MTSSSCQSLASPQTATWGNYESRQDCQLETNQSAVSGLPNIYYWPYQQSGPSPTGSSEDRSSDISPIPGYISSADENAQLKKEVANLKAENDKLREEKLQVTRDIKQLHGQLEQFHTQSASRASQQFRSEEYISEPQNTTSNTKNLLEKAEIEVRISKIRRAKLESKVAEHEQAQLEVRIALENLKERAIDIMRAMDIMRTTSARALEIHDNFANEVNVIFKERNETIRSLSERVRAQRETINMLRSDGETQGARDNDLIRNQQG